VIATPADARQHKLKAGSAGEGSKGRKKGSLGAI
jgi:hypothetical protein